MVFMIRRSLFVVVTIVMFDQPNIQMMAHNSLTLVSLVYLCHGGIYES